MSVPVATHEQVREAVARVEDPEIPVTLSDLGVLRSVRLDGRVVRVVLRPTRLACPGRRRMEDDIRRSVARVASDLRVDVIWDAVPWSEANVTAAGHEQLRQGGYTTLAEAPIRCPYCASAEVRRDGLCGGAPCKIPFTCRGCGSTFEALAPIVWPSCPHPTEDPSQ